MRDKMNAIQKKDECDELAVQEEIKRQELEKIKRWIEERRAEAQKSKIEKLDTDTSFQKKYNNAVQTLESQQKRNTAMNQRLPWEVAEQINHEITLLRSCSQNSVEFAKAKLRLSYLEKLPWNSMPFQPVDIEKARKTLDEAHYGMEQVKEEIIEHIYAMNKLGRVSNEIILLSGPPGTGKTSVARQIARALGREFYKITLGGLSDDVFLKGCARQYGGAKPGTIVDILFRAGHKNILILLDEVDKLGTRNGVQEGAAALLDALDHDQAFVDRFIDLPIDLSDIVFIATANNSSNIPAALYDRMNSIEILPYSNQDKLEICMRHILPKEKEAYQLYGNQLKIAPEVIQKIVESDQENAGIRGVTKKIRKICRIASKELMKKGTKYYYMSEKRAKEFGLIPDQVVRGIIDDKTGNAVTSGFDYSTGREALVYVESIYEKGREEPIVTGPAKDRYRDDIIQLWSYMAANHEMLLISEQQIHEGALVVNVEDLSRFQLDPNHRLGIFASMYSAMRKVILPNRHIIIGDVSLLGDVRSNSRTYGHIINALNCGARVLIIPGDIENKVQDLLGKKTVTIFTIDDLSEMGTLFNRLYFLNCINRRQFESDRQHPVEKLMQYEMVIQSIAKDEGIPLHKAYEKHFRKNQESSGATAEEKLEQLIGLNSVKSIVREIVNWQALTKKRADAGFRVKNIGLHMVFTGNPGTGKTTVAKILGKMLNEKNLTRYDRFVEVTRDDLVGKYIGHTEEKVKKVIQSAMGGVLYIDEAHSLYVDSGNDYGKIVISTLVKEMEENRENLIIIMSGYQKEMEEMVRLNAGLSDRINFRINFEDYSVQELMDIFLSLCKEEDYVLDEQASQYFYGVMEGCLKGKPEHFSNGRFVRNIFEKAKMKQALRLGMMNAIQPEDFRMLLWEDLELAYWEETKYKFLQERKEVIGFKT